MKCSQGLALVFGALVVADGCGSSESQPMATGGSAMTGGSMTGGAATGGSMTGGSTTGGAATGGRAATGGSAMAGGAGGNPSSTGGAGGSGVLGGKGGAGGTGVGAGGMGAAGGSSNAGGAGELDVAKNFDGALVTYPCGSAHGAFDCDNVGCTNGESTHAKTFQLGGKSGAVYDMTMRVRGIVEAYNYVGGTRDAGDASITKNANLFLRGGAAQAKNADGWDYDVYQFDVSPAVTGVPSTYFLNAVTKSENPHTSSTTLHLTFPIDYTVTIKVPANGTLTVKQYDSNCKSVMNCGPTAGGSCANPRKIALDGAMPAAPTSFVQPYQMPTGAYGQWLFFDVTNVVEAK